MNIMRIRECIPSRIMRIIPLAFFILLIAGFTIDTMAQQGGPGGGFPGMGGFGNELPAGVQSQPNTRFSIMVSRY